MSLNTKVSKVNKPPPKFFLDFLDFFSIFKSVKSLVSGKESFRFLDSPDFENLKDFRTGRDFW